MDLRPQFVQQAIRTILVHVEAEDSARPRLRTAVALAEALQAKLVGVGAETVQPIGIADIGGMSDGRWVSDLAEQARRSIGRAEMAFHEAAGGIPAAWHGVEASPAQTVAQLARSADLIVAGGAPQRSRDPYRTCDPADLALLAGRPVLVAPEAGGKLEASAIVVAWRDCREARRALADSLPFLKAAREVVIMGVCPAESYHNAELSTRDVVDGLRRHEVKARPSVLVAPTDRVGIELNRKAAAIGADLIVAGAYGHSRFGEQLFGGVTRDLLRNPERFVLISH